MRRWLRDLDRILRGEATRLTALREGTIEIAAGGLAVVALILGLIYGFCMGWFALFNQATPNYEQLLASTVKVPALFLLTLVVTFPSLYVFNALVGSRLMLPALMRLLMAALGVTLAVLASFGPIVAFFSVTTTSYPFMILLNVLLFAAAGFLGLGFLLQTMQRLSILELNADVDGSQPGGTPKAAATNPGAEGGASDGPTPAPASLTPPTVPPTAPPAAPDANALGALDRIEGHILGAHVRSVFRCWVIVFALVGGQMSWVLRPFIGNPAQPFTWLRPRGSNFFVAVWNALLTVLGAN